MNISTNIQTVHRVEESSPQITPHGATHRTAPTQNIFASPLNFSRLDSTMLIGGTSGTFNATLHCCIRTITRIYFRSKNPNIPTTLPIPYTNMSASVESNEIQAPVPVVAAAEPAPEQSVAAAPAAAPAKKEQTYTLAPAPLPSASPWKNVAAEIPVTKIAPVEMARKKSRTPVSSQGTKWVPIKASITVSRNGPASNAGSAASSNGRKQNNKKKHAAKQTETPETTATDAAGKKKKNHHGKHPHHAAASSETPATPSTESTQPADKQPRRKQFPKGNRTNQHRHNHNHNHKNNHNHRRHHNQNQMVQLQGNFYPAEPVMLAVNGIASQLEYYLSSDNLINDTYLRGKLSKDGYVPLSLLAQFYRIVNMSFGGDVNIILAAAREVVFNKNATVQIAHGKLVAGGREDAREEGSQRASALDNYFIRSNDWEKWVPQQFTTEAEIEKVLSDNDMDDFMAAVIQMPAQPHHHAEHKHTEAKETAPAETENKETEAKETAPAETTEASA